MRPTLAPGTRREPGKRADRRQGKEESKAYAVPKLTREGELPDITGTVVGSPPAD